MGAVFPLLFLSLSLLCLSSFFGRVHSLLSFDVAFSLFESAESVLGDLGRGIDSVYRRPGRVSSTGYMRAFSCCSLGNAAPSSRGEDPEDS